MALYCRLLMKIFPCVCYVRRLSAFDAIMADKMRDHFNRIHVDKNKDHEYY